MFPSDSDYILRVIGATFGPSNSSGNPMITLKFEVVSPSEREIGGEVYSVAGVKCEGYFTSSVMGDAEKTTKKRQGIDLLHEKFGLEKTNINYDNIDVKPFLSKCVYAVVDCKPEEKRKAPNAEQIAKNQKQGDVMKNPITGKALVDYWPKLGEIFGLADVSMSASGSGTPTV